jgi:hypothetical protein
MQDTYAHARLEAMEANRENAMAREMLNRILGVYGDQTHYALDEIPLSLGSPISDANGLETRAIGNRLDMRAALKAVDYAAREAGYTQNTRLLSEVELSVESEKIIHPFLAGGTIPDHTQFIGAVDELLLVGVILVGFEEHMFKQVGKTGVFRAFRKCAVLNGDLDGGQGYFVVLDHHYFQSVIQLLPIVLLGQAGLGRGAQAGHHSHCENPLFHIIKIGDVNY